MARLFPLFLFVLFLTSATLPKAQQDFTANDYSSLLTMPGFDADPLKVHFSLYQGYVKRTNELLQLLKQMQDKDELDSPCYAELKRHLMWEYDGMRMHEYYFDNLGGHGTSLDTTSPLYQALVTQWGSYDNWMADFKATGAMRGIGWAVLVLDPKSGRLTNEWVNEHDHGHLVAGVPILVMDVWEHAFMLQFGTDRKAYIQAFFNNINWPLVQKRYADAL